MLTKGNKMRNNHLRPRRQHFLAQLKQLNMKGYAQNVD